jgi:hypothetical protein
MVRDHGSRVGAGAAAALAVAVLGGCAQPSGGSGASGVSHPSAAVALATKPLPGCPGSATGQSSGGSSVMIDWIDMLEFSGHQYATGLAANVDVAPSKVGAVLGVTRCHIADSTAGPEFRFRDGDATFLPVGSEVHAIRGVPVTSAVTVCKAGRWLYYKVVA